MWILYAVMYWKHSQKTGGCLASVKTGQVWIEYFKDAVTVMQPVL